MANPVQPAVPPIAEVLSETSIPEDTEARVRRQQALVDRLMEREIYIYVDRIDGRFDRPGQAQVLVAPLTAGRVRIGGKELTIPEARAELKRIQELLSRELDLTGFVMVMDVRAELAGNEANLDWEPLYALALEFGTVLTPCGVENFPPIPNAARPADEPDTCSD